MNRKLIVSIAKLTDQHRVDIRSVAEKHNFDVLFFENDAEAFPELAEAEILFSQSALLPKSAPNLRWQCTPSAGVNTFTKPGTFLNPDAVLSCSSGAYGVTIAEHIIMVSLELMRRQLEYNQIISNREWKRDLTVHSLRNSRIMLMGTGDIGRETAIRLRAFKSARIIGFNRSGNNTGGLFDRVITLNQLDSVLPDTDLLIISLPGTSETDRLFDEKRLSMLPDGAFVINVGRGNVIDQNALERELRTGRLYAALDVFEQEPLPREHSLWDCPNLLITPHVAGNMTLPYTKDCIVALFLEDFENYCAGRPLQRQVDLKQGY